MQKILYLPDVFLWQLCTAMDSKKKKEKKCIYFLNGRCLSSTAEYYKITEQLKYVCNKGFILYDKIEIIYEKRRNY